MATTVLTQHTIGAPFSGTTHNNNLQLIENSFADLGPYVISGLTFAAGTGLSVNVAAGVADIGGRITKAGFTIGGLVDATTNHLYILNTGAGTSNTTGTAPANSAKLGTAVTAGGVVTTVAMGRTSGRQQFQQPQNLVHGGPSAGTASAGHPRAVNLAQWNATQAEGFEVFGTLPAGAVSPSAGAVILAPNTPTRNLVQPAADANAGLILKRFSATLTGAPLLSWQSQTGAVLGQIIPRGDMRIGGVPDGSFGTVGLYVTNTDTGGNALVVQQVAGAAGDVFDVYGDPANDNVLLGVGAEGTGVTVIAGGSGTAADQPLWVKLSVGQTSSTPALVVKEQAHFQSLFQIFPNSTISMRDLSSTNVGRIEGEIVPSWVSSTDATRKAKITHTVYDTAARSAFSIEADGSNPLTHILGSLSVPEVATSSNTTLNGSHFSIFEDTTGGNKTVTLPTAVGIDGRIYCVKNTGTGANTLTIATTSAQTIDGAAGASTSTPQARIILQSDGANWQTLAFS